MSRNWIPIGPSCVPHGQISVMGTREPILPEGHGNVSGRVSALAFRQDGGVLYAGAASGGVWKSSDDGVTWTPTMDDQPTLSVGAIAVASDGTVYVGTGEDNDKGSANGVMSGVGLLISTDGGATWRVFPPQDPAGQNDLVDYRIGRIVVHPTRPKELYVATSKGLLVTTDLQTFKLLTTGKVGPCCDVAVDFTDPDKPRVYVAFREIGIYLAVGMPTQNSDLTPVGGFPKKFKAGGRIGLALAPSRPATMYSVFENGKTLQGAFRSVDAGVTWDTAPDASRLSSSHQFNYNMVIAIDPHEPDVVFFGERLLWRRTASQSWDMVSRRSFILGIDSYQGMHDDQHALVFHPTQAGVVWAGNDGGVWKSTDGGQHFYARNRGLQTLQFYAMSQHPTEPAIVFGGTQDNGGLRYLGHPAWQHVQDGDGFGALIHPKAPYEWYLGMLFYSGNGIRRSSRSGADGTFEIASKGLNDDSIDSDVPVFVGDPGNPDILFAGTDLLFWTHGPTDGHARSWDEIEEAENDNLGGTISAIAVAPSDSHVVYYARSLGGLARLDFRDGDWHLPQTSPTVNLPDSCQQIAVHPTDPDTFYAVVGSWSGQGAVTDPQQASAERVWLGKSTASGLSLQPLGTLPSFSRNGITVGTAEIQVNAIVIDPANTSTLFVGTDYGVYQSIDGGATWQRFSDGLPAAVVVTTMSLQPTARRLRVSTMGRGVWECPLDLPDQDVDLYVRDCLLDEGRASAATPTAESRGSPIDVGDLNWNDGIDIKIDTESAILGDFETPTSSVKYDGQDLDYIGFEALDSDAPRARSKSRVYVQIHNRGPKPLTGVQVRLFMATKGDTGYPALPSGFWGSVLTDAFTGSSWTPLGDAQSLADISPAEPVIARFDRTFTESGDTVGLLAVVTAPSDAVSTALPLTVEDAVRADKHVVLKEVDVKTSVLRIVLLTLGILGLGTALVVKEA